VGRVGGRRRQTRAEDALIVASTALFNADSCWLRSGGGGVGAVQFWLGQVWGVGLAVVASLEMKPAWGWRWGWVEVGLPPCGQLSHTTGQHAEASNNAHALSPECTV